MSKDFCGASGIQMCCIVFHRCLLLTLTEKLCRRYNNVGLTVRHQLQTSAHSVAWRQTRCLERQQEPRHRLVVVQYQLWLASSSFSLRCGYLLSTRCVVVQPTSPASSTLPQCSRPTLTSSTSCPGSSYRDSSSPSGSVHCKTH